MLPDEMLIICNTPRNEDVHIKVIGDLHVGSKLFSESAWRTFKQSIKPTDKLILLGDMMDNGVISGRLGHTVYEQSMMPSAQKEWLYEELKPFAQEDNFQLLAATGGNHERRNKIADDNPLYTVLCRLKAEHIYRENAAFINVRIAGGKTNHVNTAGKYRPSYYIVATHGTGGGVLIGAQANRSERFIQSLEDTDVLITAHTHKPMNFAVAKIGFDKRNAKLTRREMQVIVATSFLDYGGYALEKMMPPTARLTRQEIILSSYHKGIQVISETSEVPLK